MVSTKTKTNLQTLRCFSIRRYISMYALVELQTYSEYHSVTTVINKTAPLLVTVVVAVVHIYNITTTTTTTTTATTYYYY